MGNKVTMKDIAEKLNLSINAVSLALNNKAGVSESTRTLVLKIADELGYFDKKPQYTKSFSSKNICVVLERRFLNDTEFYSKVLTGIEEESKKNNYDLIIGIVEENNYVVPNCISSGKVCGIIAVGTTNEDYLLKLKSYGIPMVLIDNLLLGESIDSILTDNVSGTYKATKYLIKKGFTKIGFFGDVSYSRSVKERYQGYVEAIESSNLYDGDIREYIKKYSLTQDLEKYIIQFNNNAILERVKTIESMPEAFICSNDNAAIFLMNSLKALNYKIPENISIIGFDDIISSNMVSPKLTTLRINKEFMGKLGFQKLLWRMKNKHEIKQSILLSVDLIERESVK